MVNHQQILLNIKSDLLNVFVNTTDEQMGCNKMITSIHESLLHHFCIEKSTLFINEGKVMKPLFPNVASKYHKDFEFSLEKIQTNVPNNEIMIELPKFLKNQKKFQDYTHIILLENCDSQFGMLMVKGTPLLLDFFQSEYRHEFVSTISKVIYALKKNMERRKNEQQYFSLYNLTDLFHTTLNVDYILKNMLEMIQEYFPDFEVQLIFSYDQDRHTMVNIKQFDYASEREKTIEAYVSGKMTKEYVADLNSQLLNVPIKGRQAVYGILQVSVPNDYHFTTSETNFIKMLANASGKALENAKLYNQSHRLISDLQLINETSRRLNMGLDIDEMFTYLQKQLMKSFQPMEVCFAMKQGDDYKLVESSTPLFKTKEGEYYFNYVVSHFNKLQDPLFIADFKRIISENLNYKSLMAIPLIIEQEIKGFSIVLHKEAYYFSFDSFKLMQSLIHHSSLAIANSMLRNKLQEMLDYDYLTKLHARSYLDKYVENSLNLDSSGMFLLIDIDDFKHVNDHYGHQVGDAVLVQIGQLLRKIVGKRGICARWGGEELSVYISNLLPDEALQLSNKIVKSVPAVTNPKVTVSAGLVTWNKVEKPDFQSIFLQADTALYQAKHSGKNQVLVYIDSMYS